jgi:hypothetical protein
LADRNEDVMNMVRSELEKDPKIGLESLYARAKAVDSSVGELSLRQFHARYPLQIKRGKARAEGKKPTRSARKKRASRQASESQAASAPRARRGSGQDVDREKLRSLFLEFASEFAEAESRTEIVRVIGSVDSYVDRVGKLISR